MGADHRVTRNDFYSGGDLTYPRRRNRALLVVFCSTPAQTFNGLTVEQCLNVAGPSTHSFANIGFADKKQTSFQTFLSWEVSPFSLSQQTRTQWCRRLGPPCSVCPMSLKPSFQHWRMRQLSPAYC